MALVQQLDPIYVTITQSSTELQQLRQALASGRLKSVGKDQARVTLVTENGEAYPNAGKLLFSDASVDESTGTVSLRAEFPNPKRALLPGMYVRARLEQGINEAAITVPQQAIVRSAEGASVMIVGADNKVIAQPVQASESLENKWIVNSGLKGGERIIVEGFQKAKPGAQVNPQPWQPAQNGAAPGGAPSGAPGSAPAAAATAAKGA